MSFSPNIPPRSTFGLSKSFANISFSNNFTPDDTTRITFSNLPTIDQSKPNPAPEVDDDCLNLHPNSPLQTGGTTMPNPSERNRNEFKKWTAPQAPSCADIIRASNANHNLEENDKLLDTIRHDGDLDDVAVNDDLKIKPLETRSQMAEEHDVTDEELEDTVKANAEAVSENSDEIWISTVLADGLLSNLENIKEIAKNFSNLINSETECYNNRDKVKTDNRGETRLAVNATQFKKFVDMYKSYCQLATAAMNDILSCVPEKPVEVPIHPNRTATSEANQTPDGTMRYRDKNTPTGEDIDKQFAEEKKDYSYPGFPFTPDGVASVTSGPCPAYGTYRLGAAFNMDDLSKLPAITPAQYKATLDEIDKSNKSSHIYPMPPHVQPFDPHNPQNNYPNQFAAIHNKNSHDPSCSHLKYQPGVPPFGSEHHDNFDAMSGTLQPFNVMPTLKKPNMGDLPKELVQMITKLPRDFWKYEIKQEDYGTDVQLTYDVQERHLQISLLANNTVFITSKKKFHGDYTTNFKWNDCVIGSNRKLFISWLTSWIHSLFD